MASAESHLDSIFDPDSAELMNVLRGAYRGPQDPDVELAEILPLISRDSDATKLADVLKRLVHDENPD